jgi:hypothetical protein
MIMPVGFLDAAHLAFSFLEPQGFRLVSRREGHLEFAADTSRLRVEWDHRAGDVLVIVALHPHVGEPTSWHSLDEVMRLSGVFRGPADNGPRFTDEGWWSRLLGERANDLRRYGDKALSGDKTFFRRLDLLRRLQAQVFREDSRRWRHSPAKERGR